MLRGKNRYFPVYIRRSDQRVITYHRSFGSLQQRSAAKTAASIVGGNTLHVSVPRGGLFKPCVKITGKGAKEPTATVLDGSADSRLQSAWGWLHRMHVGQRCGGLDVSVCI